VPRQMTGLAGNLEPVTPVLDAVITIEPKERTAEEFLEEIFKKFPSLPIHISRWALSRKICYI
jgi:hypothetical protein